MVILLIIVFRNIDRGLFNRKCTYFTYYIFFYPSIGSNYHAVVALFSENIVFYSLYYIVLW